MVTSTPPGSARAFPVLSDVRRGLALPDVLFAEDGPLALAGIDDARRVAAAVNEARDARRFPEQAVRAGDLLAAALIQEVLRIVFSRQLERSGRRLMGDLPARLAAELTSAEYDRLLDRFTTGYPPTAVFRGERSAREHLAGSRGGVDNAERALEELIMLRLANENPAFSRIRSLHDDRPLVESTGYQAAIAVLEAAFADAPSAGRDGISLFELLRAPLQASPTSLAGQLEYIRANWHGLLGEGVDGLLQSMLRALDVIAEERVVRGLGEGPPPVPDAAVLRSAGEDELFTEDRSWMPRVVLIAKSTHVWLDQLSRRYGREITRLDQIPDEELDGLAEAGFTALWLIGLWERSDASRRIKQRRGQTDAAGSAYALYDYDVDAGLGGHPAYEKLRERAWRRGIRLASDMVPNHVGIDGRWVVEHPDWFLQLGEPPYPGYRFTGPDLSSDPRISVQIEDHYWDATDAAVVFKRYDHRSGDTRFIYHGNDGTSMPWNDTAQLDYLLPEVREAVITAILHVARMSPIIRFDAAMTLAKRHIQRLWFPPPGQGGAIPSRAQHGLSEEEFDRRMPAEFWREVVDRVNEETPDTLLLAEAFWMLEGYFVRTLGMHRVYNSAFMHMTAREHNRDYRQLMKNVLEFDPQILQRFVNFMNNPDEETAAAQFGTGDKYIGVCTLMVTMPGLPMFGHGQIEGFREKYGMEFHRALWVEEPDGDLVERHRREVFPLVHRREQFAQTGDFLLFDLVTPDGVDEDVYAYSNRWDGRASLVVFHNRNAETAGSLSVSAPFMEKESGALRTRHLAEGLGLRGGPDDYVVFRELRSGLEFVRPSRDLVAEGFPCALGSYECRVYLDFREVADGTGAYAALAYRLEGGGVADVEAALDDLRTEPLREAVAGLAGAARLVLDGARDPDWAEVERSLSLVLDEAATLGARLPHPRRALRAFTADLTTLAEVAPALDPDRPPGFDSGWLAVWALWRLFPPEAAEQLSLGSIPLEGAEQWSVVIPILHRYGEEARAWARSRGSAGGLRRLLEVLFEEPAVLRLLHVHDHEGTTWFDRDGFRTLGRGLAVAGLLGARGRSAAPRALELVGAMARAEERSGYRLERLVGRRPAIPAPAPDAGEASLPPPPAES